MNSIIKDRRKKRLVRKKIKKLSEKMRKERKPVLCIKDDAYYKFLEWIEK